MLDAAQYLPVSKDAGNLIVAVIFVIVIGFTAYGVKTIFAPQRS